MRLFPRMIKTLMASGEIVFDDFITVNQRSVVKATFDLSQCPIEFAGDIIRILEKCKMNLYKDIKCDSNMPAKNAGLRLK